MPAWRGGGGWPCIPTSRPVPSSRTRRTEVRHRLFAAPRLRRRGSPAAEDGGTKQGLCRAPSRCGSAIKFIFLDFFLKLYVQPRPTFAERMGGVKKWKSSREGAWGRCRPCRSRALAALVLPQGEPRRATRGLGPGLPTRAAPSQPSAIRRKITPDKETPPPQTSERRIYSFP